MPPDIYVTGSTFTSIIADDIADEMSANMKEEINNMIKRSLTLNAMSDEDVIEELIRDEEVFDMLNDPSETVIEAYKFKYEL